MRLLILLSFCQIPRLSLSFYSLSCFVLFCPVLSCPVLSCPVLSCPVLSCPVLSCPVLSCPGLSCPVLSCPVLSCPVLSLPYAMSNFFSIQPLSFYLLAVRLQDQWSNLPQGLLTPLPSLMGHLIGPYGALNSKK